MALAETGSRFQASRHELLDSFRRRDLAVDNKWLDSILGKVFGSTPSHAAAKNSIAVLERRQNTGMAVRLIVMSMLTFALALGVGGVGVWPDHTVANTFPIDIKDDKALGSTKMM
jgi:hypothetical protein